MRDESTKPNDQISALIPQIEDAQRAVNEIIPQVNGAPTRKEQAEQLRRYAEACDRLAALREALVAPHEELAELAKKEANSTKRTDRPEWNAVRIKRAERAAGVVSDIRAQASEARREAVWAARAAEQFQ